MSGGITIGFVDFAAFVSIRSRSLRFGWVRFWCETGVGHACPSSQAGIDIRRSPSPNSLHDDHQADRLGPLKAETGVRFPLGAPAVPKALIVQKHPANHGFVCCQVVAEGHSFRCAG